MKYDPVQLFALVRDEAWSRKGTWPIQFISDLHKNQKELNQNQINDLMNSIISEMINTNTPTYAQFKYSQLCSLLYNEDAQKYISVFEANKEIVQRYCDNVGSTAFEQAAKQYISNIIPKLPSSNSGPSLHQPIKWMTIESQGPRLGRPPELVPPKLRQVQTFPNESSFSPPTLNQPTQLNQNSSTKWIPLSTKIQEERISHKGPRGGAALKSYSNFPESTHVRPRLSVSPKNPKALCPDDPRFNKCFTPSPSHVQKTDINSVFRMKLDTDVPIKPRVDPASRFGRSPSFNSGLVAQTTVESPLTPPPEKHQRQITQKSDISSKSDSDSKPQNSSKPEASEPSSTPPSEKLKQIPKPIPAGLKMPDGTMSGPSPIPMSVPQGLTVPNNPKNDGGFALLVSSSPSRTSSPMPKAGTAGVPPGLKMPDGSVSGAPGVPPGLKMPGGKPGEARNGIPSGLKMPDGSTSGLPPGPKIPGAPGVPPGLRMPDGSLSGAPGPSVPPGLKMPDGTTSGPAPAGVPMGLRMPDGSTAGPKPGLPPGLRMPDGSLSGPPPLPRVPPDLKMPDGTTSGLPPGPNIPLGVPPGLKMPDGTTSGASPKGVPMGLKMPDGSTSGGVAPKGVPMGLKMPDGTTSGASPKGVLPPSPIPPGLKMPDGSVSGAPSPGRAHFMRSDLGELMQQFGPPSASPARPEDVVPNPQEMQEFLPRCLDATPPAAPRTTELADLPPTPTEELSASGSEQSSGDASDPLSASIHTEEDDYIIGDDKLIVDDDKSPRKSRGLPKSSSVGLAASQTLHMSDLVRAHHHHVIGHNDSH